MAFELMAARCLFECRYSRLTFARVRGLICVPMADVHHLYFYKKLSYRRGTARCVVSVEILPIATQQCRNYLYDKS